MKNGINIIGYVDGGFGLAAAAKSFLHLLKNNNYPFNVINVKQNDQIQERHDFELNQELDYDINLYFINADALKGVRKKIGLKHLENKYEIGVWFWELSKFPEYLYSSFEVLDELWVFSDFIYYALKKISPIPVKKINFPYYQPEIYFHHKEDKKHKITFLTIFDFRSDYQRKNPLAVINAFQESFSNDESVKLIVKSVNGNQFLSLKKELQNIIKNDCRIELIDENLSKEDFLSLYQKSDVFVSLHRAEGLGLNILDAVFLEKIVIATNYGGNIDYLNNKTSFLIDFSMVPVKADLECYQVDCNWADPSVEGAIDAMREIYFNFEDSLLKVKKAKKRMLEKCSTQDSFEKFRQLISHINLTKIGAKNSFSGLDQLKTELDKNKCSKVLIMNCCPESRMLEIVGYLNNNMPKMQISIFGRESKTLKDLCDYYLYEQSGFYDSLMVKKQVINDVKKQSFDMIIVPYFNYYGLGYDNILQIIKLFEHTQYIGIGIEDDIWLKNL